MKRSQIAERMYKLFRHPLIISLCSGLIVVLVGSFIAYQFNKGNLESQMQLELYKDLIHQQSEFVDHISRDIYSRVYKLSSYYDNLKSGNREKSAESWLEYKKEVVEYNEELMFYLINLDRYFPEKEYNIGRYAVASALFKDYLNYSFKQILLKDIQPRFVKIHKFLNTLVKNDFMVSNLDGQNLNNLGKEVDSLYKRVYEFNVALSAASSYYKISAKTKLLKENFK